MRLVLAFGALLLWTGGVGSASAESVSALSTGGFHSCVLLAGGEIDCWGAGGQGRLGDGLTGDSATPVRVSGISTATAISAGEEHSCALLAGGGIECWGRGDEGQLGNGLMSGSATPVPVSGISEATAISAGGQHSCALLSGGTVECWGAGGQGQLGNGLMSGSATPVPVSGISEATAVSAGGQHSCALLATGSVECWGRGEQGQLGDGLTTGSATPVQVSGIGGAGAISAGAYDACALGASVECWGSFAPEGAPVDSTPVAVTSLVGPTAITAGGNHDCALLVAGGVECWGEGGLGQLGDGLMEDSATPVPVSGIGEATAIGAGLFHSCALLPGSVECWGANGNGQLGDGEYTESSSLPVAVFFGTEGSGGATGAPTTQARSSTGASGQPRAPIFGRTADLQPVRGKVRIRLPGRRRFAPLAKATSVPPGTVVDTTAGTVELTSATGRGAGATESGLFRAGVFRFTQKLAPSRLKGGRRVGFTVLRLIDSPSSGCVAAPSASSSRAHHGGGRLWGNAHGNYQSEGSAANVTVRGTEWLTEDTCAGTRVKVARGIVSVYDIPRHRTVLVKAPHSYLAHPGPGG